MQKRFESDPLVPGDHAVAPGADSEGHGVLFTHRRAVRHCVRLPASPETPVRVFNSPDTPMPEVQLLSNGRYHVMVTNAGGGYSRWKDLAVTRWREDTHLRQLGHVLLHPRRGERRVLVDRLSADAQTSRRITKRFSRKGERSSAAATTISTRIPRSPFRRKTTSSCAGSASPTARGHAERSRSRVTRKWCWQPPAADALHPAFSNLFVQTEIIRRAAGDPLHSPAALPRRAGAVDVSPDGRPRGGHRRSFLRNGPHAVHRPRKHRRRSASDERIRRRSRAARARCWIRLSRSGIESHSIRSSR